MKITRFYEEVLGAKLNNRQWSWGAVDLVTNRYFLRVWKDEVEQSAAGERVLVLRKNPLFKSAGYPERIRHLNAIKNGASAFGVLCVAKDPSGSGKRTIIDFDENELLVLGEIIDEEIGAFALIDGRVAVKELAGD